VDGPEEQPAMNERSRAAAKHLGSDHQSRQLPTARLEAFSDGVFAIAVTLLVLDLKVPESPQRLLEQLLAEWPSLLGYLVSFAFISASWVAHAGLTHVLRNADGVFLGLNLLLLLFVSFLPFTTSLFTKHLTDSGERVAVVAFGLNLTLVALLVAALTSYVIRGADLRSDAGRAELTWPERERWLFVGLIAGSTAMSGVLPKIAVGFYLGVSALLITQPLWRLHRWGRARRHPVLPNPRQEATLRGPTDAVGEHPKPVPPQQP
jgi:uncharacterized membrane protein